MCIRDRHKGGGGILPTEKPHFTRKQIADNFRLGCQVKVKEDMEIEIPEEVFGVKEWEATVVSNYNVATYIKEFIVEIPEEMDYLAGGYIQNNIPEGEVKYSDMDVTAHPTDHPGEPDKFEKDWAEGTYAMRNLVMKNDEEIVSIYESQITSKTKLMMVCHMINITGQILPIKKICDMAHSYGVEVMVDGAHCVGHFDFSIDDFNCDYYGSSLHKWLATPLGAGLLYVNKNKTHRIWPLLANGNTDKADIRRLNHVGTHPVHTDLAISNSIDYLNWIGIKRKEKRMNYQVIPVRMGSNV